jgi:uncharacterized protein (TIGR00725 family)
VLKKQMAVIGSADDVTGVVEEMAEEIGRGIARRGAVLISGGRGGVMEASCRGAKAEGGLVVGILPKSKEQANQYVDVAIVTDMGDARNVLNVRSADAVISVCGGAGTLSEIGLALKADRKVVALKPSGGVSQRLAGETIAGKTILAAENVDDALKLAFE